ncbi:pea pathogenicity protein 2 [Penicillium cf. viridicatum]|uniref:Pea pathogenicity protein 2 n=1 Tax=Penicillium cf. viridicatum TaxID=2972119 RepID=A0A9W9LYB2_9EURO|nr:pea pathogenicity protein 2 [Penicillium cf. viridicatum]
MPDLHSLPEGSRPLGVIRNNGPDVLAIERFKLRELAEGWPMYRDACEWENFASIFHPGAYVYTTWSGRVNYESFIQASKDGMDCGAFIMHRCHGCTTDINVDATRAVTKLKATITQRCLLEGCEVDAESDCRFAFFWEKVDGKWGARYVRHWYEKDKLIPVNPNEVPKLDQEELKTYPVGYRHLIYCQRRLGVVAPVLDLPGHRRDGSNVNGKMHDKLYWQCKHWVEGEVIVI